MRFRFGNIRFLRTVIVGLKRLIYVKIFRMDIHETAEFSLSANFDKTNPRGVHIGEYSYVAFDAAILAHDMTRGVRRHTRVGKNCFIGARSIILPGISIGDGSIVAAGAVVVKDVPPASIVAGNPAKIIRQGILSGRYGRLAGADETQSMESKEFDLD